MTKPLDIYGGKEAAQLLHVTPVTVSRWLAAGTMPDADKALAAGPVWRGSTLLAWGHRKGYLRCCLCHKGIDMHEDIALVIPGRSISVAHKWCNVDHQHDAAQDREIQDLQAADADDRGADLAAGRDQEPPDEEPPA